MTCSAFRDEKIETVSDALDIAEDKTGDFYKFSFAQWKRHRYDVKTYSNLNKNELATDAFALLNKCSRYINPLNVNGEQDFYFICLQDNQILKALSRDNNLDLQSLLVYILTHELVHIVRFCNFSQRFEISGDSRINEEKVVHSTTYEILKGSSLPKMDYILDKYQEFRICDLALSGLNK